MNCLKGRGVVIFNPQIGGEAGPRRSCARRPQNLDQQFVCGIFRLIAKTGPVDADQVDRSTDLVAHRGTDGRGVRVNGNVGLGHRRLAIIDLSKDGAQPMRHARYPVDCMSPSTK